MSDIPSSIGEMPPGTVIEFDNIMQLPVFEDMVAREVEPSMTEHEAQIWAGRSAIRELIRPLKVNGTIGNIALTVMDDAYENLINANERGIRFSNIGGRGGASVALSSQFADDLKPRYKGFVLTANALSSAPGNTGQIQAEAYYSPVRLKKKDGYRGGAIKAKEAKNGMVVVRVVSRPVLVSAGPFIRPNEDAEHVAFEVLRANWQTPPIGTP